MQGTGTAARLALAWGVIMGLVLSGCGADDDDGGGKSQAGSGAKAGTTGSSGNGITGSSGTGGMSGSGGSGGSRGFMPPMRMPVVCGGVTCMTPAGSRIQSCCLPDNTCGGGLMGECQPWDMPGTADPTCPSHMTMTGSNLTGCCKPDNQCGVMSVSGLGCIERTQLAMYADGPLEAITCGTMMPMMPMMPGEADAGSN